MKEEIHRSTNKESTSYLRSYIGKMGSTARSPLQINRKDIATGFVGGFITIFILLILTESTGSSWLMAPFGASCVLAFSVWDAPLSQPRNIIGGHFVSTFVGLFILYTLGDGIFAIALSVGLAIACMMLTRTTHPPAGADPIVVIIGAYSWSYLWSPVLIGSVAIVLVALIINNLQSTRSYPTFWL